MPIIYKDRKLRRNRNMFEKIKSTLLYGGLTKEKYDDIKEEIRVNNQKSLVTFSLVAAVAFILALLLALFNSPMEGNRIIYIIATVVMLCIVVLCNLIKNNNHIINLCVYSFMIILYATGIYLGAVTGIGEQATTFIVLLFAVPLLFVTRPLHSNTLIIFADITFVVALHVMGQESVLLGKNTVNAIIYGFVSVAISTAMMKIKIDRIGIALENQYLSETDQLSELLNRRAYDNLRTGIKDLDSTGVLFCDLNSLKYTNDNLGHEEGDNLIKRFAKMLLGSFSRRNVFRISGDEFVVILPETDKGTFEKQIEEFKKVVYSGEYPIASIGSAHGEGNNINELIALSESRMYESKKKFYIDYPKYARKA